jgi:hypothetical protein
LTHLKSPYYQLAILRAATKIINLILRILSINYGLKGQELESRQLGVRKYFFSSSNFEKSSGAHLDFENRHQDSFSGVKTACA